MTSAVLVPMHLGDLHAYETVLLALLAFGPFVVLVAVVVLLRRRDAASGHAAAGSGHAAAGSGHAAAGSGAGGGSGAAGDAQTPV